VSYNCLIDIFVVLVCNYLSGVCAHHGLKSKVTKFAHYKNMDDCLIACLYGQKC